MDYQIKFRVTFTPANAALRCAYKTHNSIDINGKLCCRLCRHYMALENAFRDKLIK